MPGIVPHRHCIICGKAIEPEEKFCSDDCKTVFEKDQKRQRNFMIAMFALFFVLLLILTFSGPR